MARPGGRLLVVLGILAAIVLAPVAFGNAAAGDGPPTAAVVSVGDVPITRATFKRWLDIAASSNPATAPGRRAYEPPNFPRCVVHKRREQRRSGGRLPRRSKAQLKARCREEYEGLRDQVLSFLILERWVTGEAADRGLVIPAEEHEAAFQRAVGETFPDAADFRRFLRQSGMTIADVRFQVAFNTTYPRLREFVIASAEPVTAADIEAFYGANMERFFEPEERALRIVLARTRAGARAARAALERGQTWHRVARTYSIDQATRHRGGLIRGIVEGSQERALDEAIFSAPKGRLRGPVKTQFGFYVFKVLEITPSRQLTLVQARGAIRRELTAERRQAADETFDEDLRAKWLPRTVCRAGFVMADCANAPRPARDP